MFSWTCPLCAQPLQSSHSAWRCQNGHNFDRAKLGYVNLLPAQHKASKEPGDSKAMLSARRDFLNAGYYQVIAKAIATNINDLPLSQNENDANRLLDCGCGDGYYLNSIAPRLNKQWEFAGVDIAKTAVNFAAKRKLTNANWVCASSVRIPLADNSVDVVLRVFAPENNAEARRVLRNGGTLVTVTPAEKHLLELKSKLYAELKPYTSITTPTGFDLLSQRTVEQSLVLDNQQSVSQLLSMTPFFWNGNEEARKEFFQLESFSLTVHVTISCYQKSGDQLSCNQKGAVEKVIPITETAAER